MADKAALIEFLASTRIHPTSGLVWEGGLIGFFVPGTATGKAIWLDRDKTLPTAAGQETGALASDGSFTSYGDGVYDIKIYDASDTLLTTPLKTYSSVNIADATLNATLTDPDFLDGTDATKIASWAMSTISSGTTRTFTLPDASGTLYTSADVSFAGSVTGASNTAIDALANVGGGYQALAAITTGIGNTAFGNQALTAVSSNGNNTAVGNQALQNTTGLSNTGVGSHALDENLAGGSNTAIGNDASRLQTSASSTTSVGAGALYFNLTSSNNTAVGAAALNLVTGAGSTGIGKSSLAAATTGANNSAVGFTAGNTMTTGSNNSFLGYNAQPSAVGVSNEITLGDTNIATLRCQVALTVLSDERDKKNIVDIPVGLDFIKEIRPVLFDWDRRDGSKKGLSEAGFIAQEVDSVQTKYGMEDYLNLIYRSNPEQLEMTKENLLPVLVKAIQELEARPCGICSYCSYYFKGALALTKKWIGKISNIRLWPRR